MPNPPKPIEKKQKLGNPGKRPPKIVPQKDPIAIPPVPEHLQADGKKAWGRIWAAGATWLSATGDIDLLVMLCEAYDERAVMKAQLAKDGHFVEGSMRQQIVHPAVKEIRALDKQLASWLSLLGFTPTDRARLGLIAPKEQNKLDELQQRRQRRVVGTD